MLSKDKIVYTFTKQHYAEVLEKENRGLLRELCLDLLLSLFLNSTMADSPCWPPSFLHKQHKICFKVFLISSSRYVYMMGFTSELHSAKARKYFSYFRIWQFLQSSPSRRRITRPGVQQTTKVPEDRHHNSTLTLTS